MGAVLVITPALLQIPLYCCQGPLSGGAGSKRTRGWKGQCNGLLGTESYNMYNPEDYNRPEEHLSRK